jgi:hypothetical protein
VEALLDHARALLLHVMRRSFTDAELLRAPELLREFESFAAIAHAYVTCDPDPLPLREDGRADPSHRPLNYRCGVVLIGTARAWGLWMVHGAGGTRDS